MCFCICRHVVAAFVHLNILHHIRKMAAYSSCILPHVPKSCATSIATNVVVILLFTALVLVHTGPNHD